jgi:oxygen-independent coproporphyrinogen-3 oxidase
VVRAVASVYVHVPWCLSRCPYCDFNTYAARAWPEDEYREALEAELGWYASRPPLSGVSLATVFFGGGTPSLFAPETIARLLDALKARFPVEPDLEVTLEANPGTIDRARLAALRAAGVNRLSIGVQTFQPRLLERLGRNHSVGESRVALDAARDAGFENLSLDLMYATPSQTLAELEDDLGEAVAARPDHVSAYALTYEPNTPLHRDLQAGRVERASEDLEAEMFERVRARLGEAGYDAYEISNHARPGREARHNRAYWRGGPYLGLGAGAHSFSPGAAPPFDAAATPEARDAEPFGLRWQNERDPARYRERVRRDGHAATEREPRTRAQALGEFCWLGLREARGIAPGEFAARFGIPLREAFPHVPDLESDGLLEARDGRLALSPRGVLLADGVFSSFF